MPVDSDVQRFWNHIIEPLLVAADADVIVEVGSQSGGHTEALLGFVVARGGVLHSIDPAPEFDPDDLRAAHPDHFVFHRALSLNVLGTLPTAGAVLIDGDHNWYTVINELRLLDKRYRAAGEPFPLTLLHDVGWPYGRRDVYHDPSTIPLTHLKPFREAGIRPSSTELAETGGLNAHLHNAIYENELQNGVLTAVQDFLEESGERLRYTAVTGGHGLGVLVAEEAIRRNPRLGEGVERLTSEPFLREHAHWLERARVEELIRVQELKTARDGAERELTAAAARVAELEASLARTLQRTAELEEAQLQAERAARDLQGIAAAEKTGRMLAEQASAYASARADELEASLTDARARTAQLEEAQREAERAARDLEAIVAAERTGRMLAEQAATGASAPADQLGAESPNQVQAQDRRELRAARRELEDLRARVSGQELALQQAHGELVRVQELARRVAVSRSWRLGHSGMRMLRRLSFRSPHGEGAIALLENHVERGIANLHAASALPPAPPSRERTGRLRPSRHPPEPSHRPEGGRVASIVAAAPQPGLDNELRAAHELVGGFGDAIASDAFAPPKDLRGLLVADHTAEANGASVDVVVCVHNALPDVHRCVSSLLEKTTRPFRLIVVDDGSGYETATYLDRLLADNAPGMALVRNESDRHGYTIAANLGLRETTADYVVLLNSDTVVTPGWLEHIVETGEADDRIGIIGPLSNAASHQSVPDLRTDGDWTVNELPSWCTPDGMALLLERLPGEPAISVPFLNGFCYAIRRTTLDTIGLLDEGTFPRGYSEENDYSRRAAEAGFALGVSPKAYVFHAKSRSYGHEERRVIAKANYRKFLDKHGEPHIRKLVAELEGNASLAATRARVTTALEDPRRMVAHWPRLGVTFVLPGLSEGGSGGSHSIFQEVSAMRKVGIEAQIAVSSRAFKRVDRVYGHAGDTFVPFADLDELEEVTAASDVIVATHHSSIGLVEGLHARRSDFLPAYYVQDYEPFFAATGSEAEQEARRSYSAIPGQVLFAKTRWLCEQISLREGVRPVRVEPSIDEELFHAVGRDEGRDRIRVSAMVRPRTPRRAPAMTLAVLRDLAERFGGEVEIQTFGCEVDELTPFGGPPPMVDHLGLLGRDAVAELLRATDVFLDCSWYQAFGRTGIEAMACGATAVMPVRGGAGEFAVHGRNALMVDTLDREAVVEAVSSLVTDDPLREALQHQAVMTGGRYSMLRSALSEYQVFVREYQRRFEDGVPAVPSAGEIRVSSFVPE